MHRWAAGRASETGDNIIDAISVMKLPLHFQLPRSSISLRQRESRGYSFEADFLLAARTAHGALGKSPSSPLSYAHGDDFIPLSRHAMLHYILCHTL